MKPVFALAVSALALLPFALPAGAQTDPSMVGVSDSRPWNQTGATFVQNVMASDKYEIAASKLALDKSRDPVVRDFARDMIAAHDASFTDIKAVADGTMAGRRVTPPPQLDPQHKDMYNVLESNFGRDFDREYLAQQAGEHRKALAYMEGYARGGGVAELQAFARHQLPVIRDHLAMLADIRGDRVAVRDVPRRAPADETIIEHADGSVTRVIETQ